MPKAIAQITIRDENDITVGATAPVSPVKDQLWLDTSKSPSVLKRYNGSSWDIVNDYSGTIGDLEEIIESNTTALEVAQGQISGLITESSIIKGNVTTLQNNYTSMSATIGGINTTVASHTTSIADINTNVSTAQSLADSKAKVFTATPTVPYKIGDLWVSGPSGDIMRCKTSRTTGSYTASEWEKASKYTDDTKANTVEGNLNSLAGRVTTTEGNYTTLSQDLSGFKTTVGTTYSTKTELGAVSTTANSKAKVFTTTPVPPYNIGDLWVGGSSANIMKCKTARASGSYTSSDWEKADKYTDDTKANAVESTVTALTERVSTTESSITQLNSSISLKVEASDITTAINSIEIGGANLLRNTEYRDFSYWDFNSSVDGNIEIEVGDFGLNNVMILYREDYTGTTKFEVSQNLSNVIEANQTYTLSGYVYVDNSIPMDAPSGTKNQICIRCHNSSGGIVEVGNYDLGLVEKNKWLKFTNTFKVGADITTSDNALVKIIGKNGRVVFSSLKLEKGKIATDWSQSLHDISDTVSNTQLYVVNSLLQQSEILESSIDVLKGGIMSTVSETYVTKSDNESQVNNIMTTINQTSTNIENKFLESRNYTEEVEGKLQTFKESVETSIRFDASGITIGKSDSAFSSKFANDKLSFNQNNNEIAYISSNKMYITDVEINNKLTIGNTTNGFFDFLPRQNGNLSVVWREK